MDITSKNYLSYQNQDHEFIPFPNESREWYVFRTKSRREKKVAEYCTEKGVHYFLPLRESVTFSGNRRHHFYPPLMPGYFFGFMNWEERHKIYTTNCIAGSIEIKCQFEFVEDLRNLKNMLDNNIELKIVDQFAEGDVLEVSSGLLAGKSVEYLRKSNGKRIIVLLNSIGIPLKFEISLNEVVTF